MSHNFLQVDDNETDIIIFGTKAQREPLSLHLWSLVLHTKYQVKNLEVILDSDIRLKIEFEPRIGVALLLGLHEIRNTVSGMFLRGVSSCLVL